MIVPQDTPGFTRCKKYRKMGWRASDTRELSFVDAAVPEENLLGERGRGCKQFLTILDGGRISVAALSVGLAIGAYDEALKYAKERQQFGQADLEVPSHPVQARRHADGDRARQADGAQGGLGKGPGARLRADGEPGEALLGRGLAAGRQRGAYRSTAATASWTSIRSRGCYRDQKINEIGEGTNEVQRLVIARLMGL